MSQISPPIRILLVCAVAFMAAWMLFLRPRPRPAPRPPRRRSRARPRRRSRPAAPQRTALAGKAVERPTSSDGRATRAPRSSPAAPARPPPTPERERAAAPATARPPSPAGAPAKAEMAARQAGLPAACALVAQSVARPQGRRRRCVALAAREAGRFDKVPVAARRSRGVDRARPGKVPRATRRHHRTRDRRAYSFDHRAAPRTSSSSRPARSSMIDRQAAQRTPLRRAASIRALRSDQAVAATSRRAAPQHDGYERRRRSSASTIMTCRARRAGRSTRRFAEHLEHPPGAATSPRVAHAAAPAARRAATSSGSTSRRRRPRRRRRLRGVGLRRRRGGGLGRRRAARGARVLDAARIGAADVAAELGGLSPGKLHAAELAADALHSALGAAVAAGARRGADAARTLVAMSGGVDSAVAALLVARAGREAVAVTLELWRDPANDAEASCCSAHAVRLRALGRAPHGPPALHARPARARSRPASSRRSSPTTRPGCTPNPCVRCNGDVRLDAMLAFADRLGAADLATGHYARVTPDGLLRAAADPAKDQSYMLAALAPASLARHALPARRADQAGGARARARGRAAGRRQGASRRTCASWPAPARRRSSPATAASGSARARSSTAPAGAIGRHRGQHLLHGRPAQGARRRAADEPLYVLAKDRDANTVTVGPARRRSPRPRSRSATRVLHRPGAEVDRVKLRYRTRPLACRVDAARRRRARARAGRAGRRRRARPGRLPDARRRRRRARRSSPADEVPGGDASPRRRSRRAPIIASSSATAKRAQRRSCSVGSGARRRVRVPVASQTSKRWSSSP